MLKIRRTESRIIEIYPSDKIQSPVHLSVGQEAISAGTCLAMKPGDHIYGTYRGHGIYIAKGGDLGKMFAELYGKDTGCARGRGGSMHLVAPEVGLMGCSAVVASLIPVATGDALASSLQGRKRVAVAFFGDGAVDEGIFFESANFAALKNLPILYLCENNGYAIHSKVSDRHKQTDIYKMAEGVGLKGRRWDGNDADLVFDKVSAALNSIRAGGPPRLLEFMTHRWYEHVGPGEDFQENYRDRDERRKAERNDPLIKSENRLTRKFKISPKQLESWKTDIDKEIDKAVRFAEDSPFPKPEQLLEDQYATL